MLLTLVDTGIQKLHQPAVSALCLRSGSVTTFSFSKLKTGGPFGSSLIFNALCGGVIGETDGSSSCAGLLFAEALPAILGGGFFFVEVSLVRALLCLCLLL